VREEGEEPWNWRRENTVLLKGTRKPRSPTRVGFPVWEGLVSDFESRGRKENGEKVGMISLNCSKSRKSRGTS
jgi:hypothetical protein